MRSRIEGVIPPHVTPFSGDGSPDLKALESLVTFWLDSGVHGLATCASNGEGPLLEREERFEVLRLVADVVGGSVPVIAGVAAHSTDASLRLIEDAARAGADAALLTPPHYYPLSRREMLEHYRYILARSELPIVLYNVPKFVGYDLPLDLISSLVEEFDAVAAVKESSGNASRLAELISRVGDKVSVLSGNADTFMQAISLGGRGGIVAVSIFAPELVVGLYEAVRRGDLGAARKLQLRVSKLNEVVIRKLSQIPATKEALRLRGLPGGLPRRPLLPLSDEERELVRAVMEEAGLLG